TRRLWFRRTGPPYTERGRATLGHETGRQLAPYQEVLARHGDQRRVPRLLPPPYRLQRNLRLVPGRQLRPGAGIYSPVLRGVLAADDSLEAAAQAHPRHPVVPSLPHRADRPYDQQHRAGTYRRAGARVSAGRAREHEQVDRPGHDRYRPRLRRAYAR